MSSDRNKYAVAKVAEDIPEVDWLHLKVMEGRNAEAELKRRGLPLPPPAEPEAQRHRELKATIATVKREKGVDE